jgi:integrase
LKKRKDTPFYFVVFRDDQDRRRELTTGERAKHKAEEVGPQIVRDAYAKKTTGKRLPWGDSLKLMREHMESGNLRDTSIQQYELVVAGLRKIYPESEGPADITQAMAEGFKVRRMNPKPKERKVKPRTVEGNIGNLSIVFGHWFRDTLKIIDGNPFEDVEPPKSDRAPPRLITGDEQKAFLDWLKEKWFRLPVLFLEVKAIIGCRISELASTRTAGLRDGRIRFMSETTKGRHERACRLPAALFSELQAVAGPDYVFERFSEGLRQNHLEKGKPHHAKVVGDFTPIRLKNWLQKQADAYFEETKAERFKLHNFRGTAMSRARMAGVAESDAAIAFGCNPATMRQHYLALDEATIADKVFEKMQGT